ncbi:MAG TPA: hypothetical protein VKU01_25320 [Bryobacteraceae bacterium]|nr:hypothetical protein [Bryobacteraceae bacterium]
MDTTAIVATVLLVVLVVLARVAKMRHVWDRRPRRNPEQRHDA